MWVWAHCTWDGVAGEWALVRSILNPFSVDLNISMQTWLVFMEKEPGTDALSTFIFNHERG